MLLYSIALRTLFHFHNFDLLEEQEELMRERVLCVFIQYHKEPFCFHNFDLLEEQEELMRERVLCFFIQYHKEPFCFHLI